MTFLKRCLWAAAVAMVAAGGASAQTTGGTTGGGITGGIGGGGLGGGGLSGGANTPAAAQVPTIESTAGGFSNSVVQPSNIIGPFFANPSFPGSQRATGTTVIGPGGFGAPLFSGTGTGATGTGGRATAGAVGARGATTTGLGGGGTTGLAGGSTLGSPVAGLGGSTALGAATGLGGGRAAGLGGATGLGGAAGLGGGLAGRAGGLGGGLAGRAGGLAGGLGGQQQGQVNTGRNVIAYTQTLKFGVPPITPAQLQADLGGVVATSPTLSAVSGLQTTVNENGIVVLKGRVADEDEARLVEGVIALTPGVRGVQNELEYPKPPAP